MIIIVFSLSLLINDNRKKKGGNSNFILMQFLERFYHKRLLRDKDDTYGIKYVFYEGKRDNVSCFLALHSLFLCFVSNICGNNLFEGRKKLNMLKIRYERNIARR